MERKIKMKIKSSAGFSIVRHLSILAVLTLAAPDGFGQVLYTVTDLGSNATPMAINNSGQVAGVYSTNDYYTWRAFLYTDKLISDVGTLGGQKSQALGINTSAQVVGFSYTSNNIYHAFLYSAGLMTDLGTLPGGTYSIAFDINCNGQIVGESQATNDYGTYAYAFEYSDGVMCGLGTLGGSSSHATGINDSAQIVGYADTTNNTSHAFLYSQGVMIDLGTLGGESQAKRINNSGQVVGWAYTSNNLEHAFLYSAGLMTDLGTLGGLNSEADAINNSGQVVGYAHTSNGVPHAFVYSGGVMIDLNSLIPSNAGLILRQATAINDNGQIVGFSASHAFLLTPTHPSIDMQPQSTLVHAHNDASLSVTVSSAAPLNYQWSLNGTNIAGATSRSLIISNVTQANLGAYAVTISNAFGSVTSSNALLSMYPFIATPFLGLVTYWGYTNTLSLVAWGTGPLCYQWFKDGSAILNATNAALTLSSIQASDAGMYSVIVSSPLGSVTNAPAQVVVNPAGVSLGLRPSLTIEGVVGYNYIIQGSTNIADTNSWSTITTLMLQQPVQLWVDTNTDVTLPANPHRYYRVVSGQ